MSQQKRPRIDAQITDTETFGMGGSPLDTTSHQRVDAPPSARQQQEACSARGDVAAADADVSNDAQNGVAVGATIGKYELLRVLGRGGQGTAYLALDPDLQRQVVIKCFHAAKSDQARQSVLREGRTLAKVNSPYVAHCYGADQHHQVPYLIMEYVPGLTLAEYRRTHKITPARALEIVGQIAEGLRAIHQRGLLHRDLKPSNMIVAEDGRPRIVDFGLAVAQNDDALRHISGTPAYMAPEQARGDNTAMGPPSDLFGLGAVLFELLTGKPPYDAASPDSAWRRAKAAELQISKTELPQVSPALLKLCQKSLAANPGERFSTVEEFQEAIAGRPEGRPPGIQFSLRFLRWNFRLSLAASVAVLLIIAFASLIDSPHRNERQIGQAPENLDASTDSLPANSEMSPTPRSIASSGTSESQLLVPMPVPFALDLPARMSKRSTLEFELGFANADALGADRWQLLDITQVVLQLRPNQDCLVRILDLSDRRGPASAADNDPVSPMIVRYLQAADSPTTIRWELSANFSQDRNELSYYFLAYPVSESNNDPLAEIHDLPALLRKRARRLVEQSADNAAQPSGPPSVPADAATSDPLTFTELPVTELLERLLRLTGPETGNRE
jgi:serine/threonine protein kinase